MAQLRMLQIVQWFAWRIDCRGNTEKAKTHQILQKGPAQWLILTPRLPTARLKSIRWCAATTTPSTGALFRVAGRHVTVALLDLLLENMKSLGLSKQNLEPHCIPWFMLVYVGLSSFSHIFSIWPFWGLNFATLPARKVPVNHYAVSWMVGCCFSAQWQQLAVTQNLCEPWTQPQLFDFVWLL